MIGSSGGSNLSGWPILPEHGSILRLDLHGIPLGVVKTGMILVGIGFATESSAGRRLSNDWLEMPAFWAIHFYMVMNEDDSEEEDLIPQLLGISMQEINDFYTQNISDQHSRLPWPYFSIRSPQGCVVEVEYAASEEFQTRFKIGDEQGLMTLGYWSGHQSLPAFRWPEIVALGNSFADEKMCAAVILLLLPAATVTPDQREVATAVLVQCLESMQLFANGDRSRFARIVIGHSVSEREWVNDPELGWIYENEYSQRSLKSLLSKLRKPEFLRIKALLLQGS